MTEHATPAVGPEGLGEDIGKARGGPERRRFARQGSLRQPAVSAAEEKVGRDHQQGGSGESREVRPARPRQAEEERERQQSRQVEIDDEDGGQLWTPVAQWPEKHHPEGIHQIQKEMESRPEGAHPQEGSQTLARVDSPEDESEQ